MDFLKIFFYLSVAHAVTDGLMQDPKWSSIGTLKQRETPYWYFWLIVHALIQGAGVGIATQLWPLGIAETVFHGFIDLGAICKRYNLFIDQVFHLCCKIAWAVLYVAIC